MEHTTPLLRYFSGRRSELDRIHYELQGNTKFPVFIFGPRGIGKSTLANAYSQIHSNVYLRVVNINLYQLYDLNSIETIINTSISNSFNIDIRGLNDLRSFVISSGKKILLVIDNLEVLNLQGLNNLFNIINKIDSFCKMIIISSTDYFNRLRNIYPGIRLSNIIYLGSLSTHDMYELIRKRIDISYLDSKTNIYNLLLSFLGNYDFIPKTPRFALMMLNRLIEVGSLNLDLKQVYERVVEEYFVEPTSFLLGYFNDEIKMRPVNNDDSRKVIMPNQSILFATPQIIIPNLSNYMRGVLIEFEELINREEIKEKEIQEFIEAYPQFLKCMDYKNIVAHPVLQRDDDGPLIPDFFIQPYNEEWANILDLKLPTKKVFVGTKDRKHLSSSVQEVIAQLREYRNYFDNEKYREYVKKRYGLTSYKPNVIAVIGRREDIPSQKVKDIMEDTPKHLEIITYDDFIEKIKYKISLYAF